MDYKVDRFDLYISSSKRISVITETYTYDELENQDDVIQKTIELEIGNNRPIRLEFYEAVVLRELLPIIIKKFSE